MGSTYPRQPLGDYFRIKHGYAFKGEHFVASGEFVLLTPGNFEASGGLKLKGDREKYYDGDIPSDFVLCRGDLIVAMTDLTQNAPILGAPALVPEDNRFLQVPVRSSPGRFVAPRHVVARSLLVRLVYGPSMTQV